MKKFFCVFAFFIFLFQSFAFGKYDGNRSIYFCHRDIDSYIEKLDKIGLGFLGREENVNYIRYKKKMDDPNAMCYENDKLYENARNFSTRLNSPFWHLKHCFFLMADKISEFPEEDIIVLSLRELETRGYGKAGLIEKEPVVGGEDKETIKHKLISCVPIIKDNDHDKKLVSKLLGYNTPMSNLDEVWGEILDLMDKKEQEKEKGVRYGVCGNNCCTPAYDITEQLIGDQNALNLVNPVSFNLFGMGILWGEMIGENVECIAALMRAGKGCWQSLECGQATTDAMKKCAQAAIYNTKEVSRKMIVMLIGTDDILEIGALAFVSGFVFYWQLQFFAT